MVEGGRKQKSDLLGFEERSGQRDHLGNTSKLKAWDFFSFFCLLHRDTLLPHANSQHRTPSSCNFILYIIVYCQVSLK